VRYYRIDTVTTLLLRIRVMRWALSLLLLPLLPVLVHSAEPVELVGRASEYWFDRNWRSYYWREDFTFLLADEASGRTWRIISREPTPAYIYRMGTTFTDLKVDWKARPRVKVVGVRGVDRLPAEFYTFKLDEAHLATALVVLVETTPGVWKEFFVNNWFHKWGDKADKAIHAWYADKPNSYDIYGFVKGQAAPFDKKSQAILDKNKDNPSMMFHGRVRTSKDTPSDSTSN
jgi:hypothetical protein